ncbi:MAG: DUF885 domain-containing protein [Verrucomicrobia bacterium]|nr:DUF885 domain-containing protein [Verrucomicrobiota bacterium]
MQRILFLAATVLAGGLMAAPGSAFTAEQVAAESAKANAFFDRVFDEATARSPMTEAQLGIRKDMDKWDDLSDERALEDFLILVRHYGELRQTIRYEALDEPTRLSYRMWVEQAEHQIEGWRWRHHGYVFTTMFGMHTDAPSFLINYHPIASVADARAYLARLRGLGPLLDQQVQAARDRAAEGVRPPRFEFALLESSVKELLTGQPYDAGPAKNALYEDFVNKVAALQGLDAATRAALETEARAALREVVRPAYERMLAFFAAEEKVATDDDGVWKLPDGDEYYAYCLREYTTTHLSAEAVHQLGLREVARIHREMHAIMDRVGFHGDLAAFFKYLKEDPKFYYPTTPDGKAAYLKRATEIIDAVRARLDEFCITKPKAPLIVKMVEPYREKGEAAAFLDPATPDGSKPGIYYINTGDMTGLPIFEMETLAHHEALPGHHLQIAISYEQHGLPKFRRFGGNSAFEEGWALYSEYFPKEFGFYSDPYQDFGRLYDELLRAVRLVVDTGLHAKHWTRAQVMDYFRQNTPESERDLLAETNRYVVWPGQACSYKVGMLKILELRERAKRQLGPAFSLREFHDVVLRNGAVPMDILEQIVDAWIAEKRR